MPKITPTLGSAGLDTQAVQKINFRYGRSVSAISPATDISSGTDNKFDITINGDGPHTVTLYDWQVLKNGNDIARSIERSVSGVVANDPENNLAFRQFQCAFQDGRYVLVSGLQGDSSEVVVSDSGSDNVADDLNIGIANGGTEDAFYPNESAYATYVDFADKPVPVKSIQVFTKPFDAITAEYPSATQEIYKSRVGGIAGVVQQTLTVNYTDATKEFFLDLEVV